MQAKLLPRKTSHRQVWRTRCVKPLSMMSYKILINNITSLNIQIDYTDYRDNEFIFSRTNVNIYLFFYIRYIFLFPLLSFRALVSFRVHHCQCSIRSFEIAPCLPWAFDVFVGVFCLMLVMPCVLSLHLGYLILGFILLCLC